MATLVAWRMIRADGVEYTYPPAQQVYMVRPGWGWVFAPAGTQPYASGPYPLSGW